MPGSSFSCLPSWAKLQQLPHMCFCWFIIGGVLLGQLELLSSWTGRRFSALHACLALHSTESWGFPLAIRLQIQSSGFHLAIRLQLHLIRLSFSHQTSASHPPPIVASCTRCSRWFTFSLKHSPNMDFSIHTSAPYFRLYVHSVFGEFRLQLFWLQSSFFQYPLLCHSHHGILVKSLCFPHLCNSHPHVTFTNVLLCAFCM